MESTKLSTILNRMYRWTTIYRNTEEQYLVRDLDEAMRHLQREHLLPWSLQKTSLRVFSDILEYPKADDHLFLAFIEGREKGFENKPKPYYTSIKEFYSDPTNRSQVAEIWGRGTNFLGVRNKQLSGSNISIDECELDSGYTISGDVTAKAIDNVIFNSGSGSLRLTVVENTGSALLEKTFTGSLDTLYKRKYFFVKIQGDSIPTSINLRYGADDANYLLKNVTTQFSGQTMKKDDFFWVAIDLNDPDSTVGTVDTTTQFNYYAVELVGAASGNYYIDTVSKKEWRLMDYWYYSNLGVKTLGNSYANQKYLMNSSEIYSTDSELVTPDEFVDVIMYDAELSSITDIENSKIYPVIQGKKDKAWDALVTRYPSLEPLIITHRRRFSTQMGNIPHVYDPAY